MSESGQARPEGRKGSRFPAPGSWLADGLTLHNIFSGLQELAAKELLSSCTISQEKEIISATILSSEPADRLASQSVCFVSRVVSLFGMWRFLHKENPVTEKWGLSPSKHTPGHLRVPSAPFQVLFHFLLLHNVN